MINSSFFSFFICELDKKLVGLPNKRSFGKYMLSFDNRTPLSYASNNLCECVVFGLAINIISNDCDEIALKIINNCNDIQAVIEYEKQLGGKYVLLFRKEDQYYIQGDATCSIPIFYSFDRGFICSSNYKYIVDEKKYTKDREYDLIRKSGDVSQAMPFDITSYRQIKQLLPNHYLDVKYEKAVRFINSKKNQKTISVEKATEIVLPMIENLLGFYSRYYKIYCPITSGRDSRVVLAFLVKRGEKYKCYTIKHSEHNEKSQDIIIPIELCKKNKIEHEIIEDVVVSEEIKEHMNYILGKDNFSERTLMISQTIKEHYNDGAILNGDIIGQVGKCSLHRDIPRIFATPSYFRCKLHNYSAGAKKQLNLWLEEIKESGEKISTFDLFSIENRMGRWASQENMIYNTIGQMYLNIFNSRSIIYVWTAVSRKKRKRSLLHIDLINKIAPTLLDVCFEQEKSVLFKISKANGIFYWLSSFAKYYLQKSKFKKEENYEKNNNNCR